MLQNEKIKLVDARNITLDGKPAKIAGSALEFAVIHQLDGPIQAEFAWETVKRIVDRDGKFTW